MIVVLGVSLAFLGASFLACLLFLATSLLLAGKSLGATAGHALMAVVGASWITLLLSVAGVYWALGRMPSHPLSPSWRVGYTLLYAVAAALTGVAVAFFDALAFNR